MSQQLRIALVILIVLVLYYGSQPKSVSLVGYDPYSQAQFPCQEDEVLGYSPSFGPDRVGCISLDLIPD